MTSEEEKERIEKAAQSRPGFTLSCSLVSSGPCEIEKHVAQRRRQTKKNIFFMSSDGSISQLDERKSAVFQRSIVPKFPC